MSKKIVTSVIHLCLDLHACMCIHAYVQISQMIALLKLSADHSLAKFMINKMKVGRGTLGKRRNTSTPAGGGKVKEDNNNQKTL